jgi:hypothetical protein
MSRVDIVKAIAATSELCGGRPLSPAAAALFVDDLAAFPEHQVMAALTRCRKEIEGKPLTVAAVIARIDDGRPGPQEAWSMMPFDESASVVWSDEMRVAWFVAEPLLDGRQNVAARMAFLEAYARAVTMARDQRQPARWMPSLGQDQHGRAEALRIAVEKGRISIGHARTIAPQLEAPSPRALQLLGQVNVRRIQ